MRTPPPPLVLALLSAGCGAHAATHADFARIQRGEADLDRAVYVAQDDDAPCADRCAGARDALEGAHAVCSVAEGVDDPDAHARCDAARRRAREVRAAAASACGCEGGEAG